MNIAKLLSMLTGFYRFGVVEVGGGAVIVDEDEPAQEVDDQQGEVLAEEEAAPVEAEQEDAPAQEDDEIIVSIGEEQTQAEEDSQRAPEWVRELRRSNREKDRKLRELEQENARLKGLSSQPSAVVVGDKPTLEACDYDTEKFEQELEGWYSRKREFDEQQRQAKQTEEQQRAHWQTRLDAVTKASAGLKVKDLEDAAMVFEDTFSPVQQGIIIGGPDSAESSALLRYALGKNPKKAKELAAINDPVKFTFAIANLEKQLKVTPRKAAPAPDTRVASSMTGAAAVDSQLERLQAEADKTGDRSKVAAYMRKKRLAQQAA